MRDNQIGLRDVMIQATCNDFTYERTIELLIKINCEMSEPDQTIKMANMQPSKSNNNEFQKSNKYHPKDKAIAKQYCYNFNEAGTCHFGRSCYHLHQKDPTRTAREQREPNKGHQDKHNEAPASVPITSKYRTDNNSGGAPNGRGNFRRRDTGSKTNALQSGGECASLK